MFPYIGREFVETLRLEATNRQTTDRSSAISQIIRNRPRLTFRRISAGIWSLRVVISRWFIYAVSARM